MLSIVQPQPQKMNLQLIFPTPVGFFNFGEEFTQQELSILMGLEQKKNEGNLRSIESNVLSIPGLERLKGFVFDCVDNYFREIYRPFFEVSLRVTQSWVNYTNENQYHHKHRHSNSFVSGVFYIQTNDQDRITFYKHLDQSLRITAKEFTPINSESWWFETKTGALLLFPSGLEHMVEAKKTTGTRVSLAFNTFPVGIVGDKMALNEANLIKVAGDE